mgnify:CR=1 FL=1
MPEWLIGLIGALIGSGATLAGTYFTHRWKMAERYQELLAEKRLSACSKLMGSLIEIDEEFSPWQNGIQPLLNSPAYQHVHLILYCQPNQSKYIRV